MTDTAALVPVTSAPTETDLQTRMAFAKAMATAGMLPPQYRNQPGNLLLADQYARDLDLPMTTILTGIHVIEGKPSASAAVIGGLVRRAGHKLRITTGTDDKGELTATATIIRADDPDHPFVVTWTMDDARLAKLDRKDNWVKYARAMLKARAITECAREACPEALLGVQYTPEELGVVVDEDGAPAEGPVHPPRPVQPQTEQVYTDVTTAGPITGEIVDDGEGPGLSAAQMRNLHRLFNSIGVTDRAERLGITAEFLEHPVESSNDLTKEQASRLIDYLESGGR